MKVPIGITYLLQWETSFSSFASGVKVGAFWQPFSASPEVVSRALSSHFCLGMLVGTTDTMRLQSDVRSCGDWAGSAHMRKSG